MKKRTLINSMQINTISRNSNQDFIRSAVKEFVKQIDLTITEMSDISTAVGEAIQNIVDFAYDNIGKIQVEVLIYEGNYIKIKIRDWGCGIDNVKQAMEPLYTTKDEFIKKYNPKYHLMENKELGTKRPTYFCFIDKVDKNILWFVPMSSKYQ